MSRPWSHVPPKKPEESFSKISLLSSSHRSRRRSSSKDQPIYQRSIIAGISMIANDYTVTGFGKCQDSGRHRETTANDYPRSDKGYFSPPPAAVRHDPSHKCQSTGRSVDPPCDSCPTEPLTHFVLEAGSRGSTARRQRENGDEERKG